MPLLCPARLHPSPSSRITATPDTIHQRPADGLHPRSIFPMKHHQPYQNQSSLSVILPSDTSLCDSYIPSAAHTYHGYDLYVHSVYSQRLASDDLSAYHLQATYNPSLRKTDNEPQDQLRAHLPSAACTRD